jgi:hypothetical protein
MRFLQALFLLVFYLKYTDQLSIHGGALFVILILDILSLVVLALLKKVAATSVNNKLSK